MSTVKLMVFVLVLVLTKNSAYATEKLIGLHLSKGNTYKWNYRIEKKVKSILKGDFSSSSLTVVSMNVVNTSKQGIVLELQNGKTLIEDSIQQEALNQAYSPERTRFLESIKVLILVNNLGEVVDILNFEELKNSALQVIDLIKSASHEKEITRSTTEKFLQDVFSTKEGIAGMFLKDTPLLFHGSNINLKGKRSYPYETELLNIFGGEPIKAKGKVVLEPIDKTRKTLNVSMTQEIDKESFVKMLDDVSKRIENKKPSQVTFNEVMKDSSINDSINVKVDLKTGLSLWAKTSRISNIAGTITEDTVEYSMIK